MITINVTDPTPNEAICLARYFLNVAGKDYMSINNTPVGTISNVTIETDVPTETITTIHTPDVIRVEGTHGPELNFEVRGNELVGNITIPKPIGEPSLDKKGMPWDERIHSSSKVFNADGSWRIRRNVDPAYVTQIENELRGVALAPSIVPPPPPVEPDPTLAFVNFVNKITAAQSAKTLHIADVNVQVLKAGLKSLPELATRTELIPAIELALGI